MGDTQRQRLEERIASELVLIIALLGVAIVQVALPPRLFAFLPNVLLLLVVCRALLAGASSAARWAFYGGLAIDLCSGSVLGSHAVALLAAALAALVAFSPFNRTSWLVPIVGTLLGALAYHAVQVILISIMVAAVDLRSYVLIAALPETLATVIPALPIFLMMRWLAERRRGRVSIDVY
ncbi:MAG: rod shape-determining protein MreD [Roseiflexaceae bacterium]|nr:rod shape-determining protein MreD [Roseiflexaceae bacterium]